MGIEQLLIETEKKRSEKKGLKRGFEKGIEKGEEKKSYDVVENLIVKLGLSDEQAADIAEVSVDFVRNVRSALQKKK